MARKRIGYFDGTDSRFLTLMICDGHDTIPISNGLDNHGKHIRLFNEEDHLDLIVGYLHKIYSPEDADTRFEDIFHSCMTYEMPLLIEVPHDSQECARAKLGAPSDVVQFVDPKDMLEAARNILG